VTAPATSPTAGQGLGLARTVRAFLRLKWHLLLGGLRGRMQQRIQTALAVVAAFFVGCGAAAVLSALGRGFDQADQLVVVLLPLAVLGLGLLSAAAGVEATIDPRHLATEPLTRTELGVGLLVSAVVGPASLLALLSGLGVLVGWGDEGVVGWALAAATVLGWWLTLLLFSRTTANLLGAVASSRFRQIAQFAASGSALLAWIAVQLLSRDATSWPADRWETLADLARWTPPGQLGQALGALDRPAAALGHLLLGLSWLPLLAWASIATTSRLAHGAPRPSAVSDRVVARPAGLRTGLRGLLRRGPVGALAARTLTTKVRTPRQAVNTLTALVVGAGVLVIGPILEGGPPDPRTVLLGGLLHFAVLFDGNNAFGMDGPALWLEVTSGADARVLVRGKVTSSLVVMALPALLVPVGLAALSGGWQWLPAAWLIAAGSLLASAGVAVASASLAPVSLPDSPNPLASGDAGQGCVAGLMLGVGMLTLAVITAPVAVAVFFASGRSALLTTGAALLAPVVGALALWACTAISRARLRGREAELVHLVTPNR
jgi:hypothetical protein